jgi:hypothetical protein
MITERENTWMRFGKRDGCDSWAEVEADGCRIGREKVGLFSSDGQCAWKKNRDDRGLWWRIFSVLMDGCVILLEWGKGSHVNGEVEDLRISNEWVLPVPLLRCGECGIHSLMMAIS